MERQLTYVLPMHGLAVFVFESPPLERHLRYHYQSRRPDYVRVPEAERDTASCQRPVNYRGSLAGE